jgi:hypothetical protein
MKNKCIAVHLLRYSAGGLYFGNVNHWDGLRLGLLARGYRLVSSGSYRAPLRGDHRVAIESCFGG